MRVNEKTIKLAKIRRYIRQAIKWYERDGGMPAFYNYDNYKMSKEITNNYYYVKSDRAIKEIAEKIYNELNEREVINVRLDNHEMRMLNSGASLSRLFDKVFLKIYHSNYKEDKK